MQNFRGSSWSNRGSNRGNFHGPRIQRGYQSRDNSPSEGRRDSDFNAPWGRNRSQNHYETGRRGGMNNRNQPDYFRSPSPIGYGNGNFSRSSSPIREGGDGRGARDQRDGRRDRGARGGRGSFGGHDGRDDPDGQDQRVGRGGQGGRGGLGGGRDRAGCCACGGRGGRGGREGRGGQYRRHSEDHHYSPDRNPGSSGRNDRNRMYPTANHNTGPRRGSSSYLRMIQRMGPDGSRSPSPPNNGYGGFSRSPSPPLDENWGFDDSVGGHGGHRGHRQDRQNHRYSPDQRADVSRRSARDRSNFNDHDDYQNDARRGNNRRERDQDNGQSSNDDGYSYGHGRHGYNDRRQEGQNRYDTQDSRREFDEHELRNNRHEEDRRDHRDPPQKRHSYRLLCSPNFSRHGIRCPCLFCDGEHLSDECPEVVAIEDRENLIMGKGHCLQCLGHHHASVCTEARRLQCKYCHDKGTGFIHHCSICPLPSIRFYGRQNY